MRKRLTPLKCHIVRGKDFLSLSRSGCLQLTSSAYANQQHRLGSPSQFFIHAAQSIVTRPVFTWPALAVIHCGVTSFGSAGLKRHTRWAGVKGRRDCG